MYRFTTMRRTFPDYNGRFLGLMYGIDSAIIKYFNPSADLKDIMIMKMPYPAYYTYYMGNFIRYFVAVTLVLGLILPTLQLTKEIVYDREKKLKVSGFKQKHFSVHVCFLFIERFTLITHSLHQVSTFCFQYIVFLFLKDLALL